MDKIEKLVKEYSSKKLREIVEHQSSAYSENFIDYAKDELIRRGESFPFSGDLEKEVTALNDNDLKNLVEKEWDNFHLEYLEIARKEYLKRKFKNETGDIEQEQETEQEAEQGKEIAKRYPALRTIAEIYTVSTVIIGILGVIILIYAKSQNVEVNLMIVISSLLAGALLVLGSLAVSQLIKVFIDIEENTRKFNK